MAKSTSQTSKKRKTKKKAKRRSAKKKPTQVAVRYHPDDAETQLLVWATYAQVRSARGTAAKLNMKDWVVREVLKRDRSKLMAIIDGHMESLVAEWESMIVRSQGLMLDVLTMAKTMVIEINTADVENRTTVIRDLDGYPMPVLDAKQFMIMSRLLDQVVRLADRAQSISMAYRTGQPFPSPIDGRAGDDVFDLEKFEQMDDLKLARIITEANLTLPPVLAQKVKMIAQQDEEG